MPDTTPLLNDQQAKAVQHGDGPLLIIAGAGTGKTTVITERIKHLILEKNIPPSEILALTFTEKASREMEERIDVAMPYGYTQLWVATFHSFCDRILRNEAIHIGLNPGYHLMSEAESIMFFRKNLFKFELEYFRPLGNPYKFIEGMLQHFSRLKDEDVSPIEYTQWVQNQKSKGKMQNEEEMSEDEIKKYDELSKAFQKYEELKAQEGVMDFSDLIANTLQLFRKRPHILKTYQDQFKYILVDEFQDTNFAQNTLAIMLSGQRKNITVVGDDDQAIYRWRGAAISNIIQFRKQFPKATILALTHNYRSTQTILDTSYRLIQFNNPDRLEIKEKIDKHLIATRGTKGKAVELLYKDRVEDEAEAVVEHIREYVSSKSHQYKDVAILVRANDHATPFVRALERSNIPYQFLGPGRLFRQEEIKDLVAYLKVLYNFEDSAALYRVLHFPIFAIEPRDIAALLNFSKRKNMALFEILEGIAEKKEITAELFLSDITKEKLTTVTAMLKRHLKRVHTDTAGQILYFFMEDAGMLQKMLTASSEAEQKRFQNIAKFFDKLKSYEAEHDDASVFAVVDWIDLSMLLGESPLAADTDWSENNAVNILTIHSSKGLEFPLVFLVNLVSQRFPTRERKEQLPIPSDLIKEILPEGDFHLEEERRLFYVGMTRARDQLFLTAANFYGEGKRDRKLSPFIAEALGEEVVPKFLKKRTIIQPSLLDWVEKIQAENGNQPMSLHNGNRINGVKTPPITYLSYSQIQTFEFCPLHYKLRYVYKLPSVQSAAQSFGTSVHAALRDFYTGAMQNLSTSVDTVDDILKKVWLTDGYHSKSHEKDAFEKANVLLKTYLKKYFTSDNGRQLGLEIPFIFSINHHTYPGRYLKIGGRIDRVDRLDDNTIEIIDYKTGSNVPDDKKIAKDLQMTVYALAAMMVKDSVLNRLPDKVKLSLVYLEEDKKISTTRTLEQLEDAKRELIERADAIAKSDFLCIGNSFCRECEYRMLCTQIA